MATVTCDTVLKQQLMSDIVKQLKRKDFNERTTRFFILAARSALFRLKLSSDNSFDLFMEFLNSVGPDIPDGADFIDFIGDIVSKSNVMQLLNMMPALDGFLNWMKDECVCDVFLGVAVKDGACHFRVQTEGVRELYEKVIEGFAPQHAQPMMRGPHAQPMGAYEKLCFCRVGEGPSPDCCGQPGCDKQSTCQIKHQHKASYGQPGFKHEGPRVPTCKCQVNVGGPHCCGKAACPKQETCGVMHVHR